MRVFQEYKEKFNKKLLPKTKVNWRTMIWTQIKYMQFLLKHQIDYIDIFHPNTILKCQCAFLSMLSLFRGKLSISYRESLYNFIDGTICIEMSHWCWLYGPSQYLSLRTVFGGSMDGRQILEFNFHSGLSKEIQSIQDM